MKGDKMITAKEALSIYRKNNPDNEVVCVIELPDMYAMPVKGSDAEGYDVVDKKTGSISFKFIMELLVYDPDGWIKHDISKLLE